MRMSRYILPAILCGILVTSCKPDTETIYIELDVLTPYELVIPKGFPPMDIPADNQMTVQGVALGRKLFYDERLSGDNTQACATCHLASSSFSDPDRFSTGIDGSVGDRNAMAIVNLGWVGNTGFFWDGRALTLEEQALGPVTNPIEMNATWPDVLVKLNADEVYRNEFKIAFGVNEIDSLDVAKALAQFERTLISGNSRFDQFFNDSLQLTDSEFRGFQLFGSEDADCFHCHGTKLTMGFENVNNGLQQTMVDFGVGGVTGNAQDIGKFKAPTLRNIAVSGPYMHDGRFNTLEEVIEFYNSGVNQNSPNIAPEMKKNNRPGGSLHLSPQQKEDLLAFLNALTDQEFLSNPEFQNPN